MARLPWGSVNPFGYLGLGAGDIRRDVPFIISGPQPLADLNTPWENRIYRARAKAGAKALRRDFRALQRGARRMAARPTRGLGFGEDYLGLGVPVAAVAAAPKIASGLKKTFQKSDPRRDAGRDDATNAALNLALGGNAAAAAFIRQRTGRYGTKQVPGYGLTGRWASDHSVRIAREAWARIKTQAPAVAAQADRLMGGGGTVAGPTTAQAIVAKLPPSAQEAARSLVTGTAVESALFTTPDAAGTAAPAQATVQDARETVADARVSAAAPARAGISPMMVGAGLVVGYLLLGKKGRR